MIKEALGSLIIYGTSYLIGSIDIPSPASSSPIEEKTEYCWMDRRSGEIDEYELNHKDNDANRDDNSRNTGYSGRKSFARTLRLPPPNVRPGRYSGKLDK